MAQLIAGRFELGDFVAQGGMGTVYRGQDVQTGQQVGIKLLRPDIATNPENMERFAHEGEMLRTLNHPNIVKLLMATEDDGKQYLIMEYVVGGSLADLLNKVDHLSVKRSLAIALELADALARAHHLKIIHRDLKPANVLIAEDGTPRLSDFGIARIGVSQLTPHGTILGTLAYAPPETFSGGPLDARADIWAFGVTLFEMLTGQKPFNAHTSEALIAAILHQPTPDLAALCPTAPIELIDLVYRMLEKDPRRRIGSMRHIAAELETIQNDITHDVSSTDRPLPRVAPLIEDPQPETSVTAAAPNPTPIADNLPSQTTPFIGRERELGELTNLLADPSVRLITIVGPGGMGKTRLALETAATHKSEYTHGVFFIPLAPLTDPEAILSTVADAVNFQFFQGSAPHQQLINFFRLKTMLLIFDNFEHILGGTGLVMDILQAAPGVKVIATSREILNLRAESLYRIEGLTVPNSEMPEDSAGDSAAVQLFVQTARRVRPSFVVLNEYDAVIRICQLVDGMPLGIELAAALVRRKSCRDIASQIESGLDALTIGWQDIPERHRSMRAVFEYSWNLLAADEQALFQKLWVFHGTFSAEAAEDVAGATETSLYGLIDKSMVNEVRISEYELHSLLRQYSEEKSGGPDHADEQRALLSRAADYFHAHSKPAVECKTVADLAPQLAEFGYRMQLEEYNTAAELLFTFDRYLGGLWGQYELVIAMHESLQGKITEPTLVRASLNNLGLSLIEISQVNRGITYLQELFENAHMSKDVRYELSAVVNLGIANAKLGHFHEAIGFYNQAMNLSPSEVSRLTIIANIAEAQFGLGEFSDAIKNYDHIITATENNLTGQISGLIRGLSQVQMAQGDIEKAEKTLSEAVDISTKDGALTVLRMARINQAALHLFKDDPITARQAIKLAHEFQASQDECLVDVLDGLTAVCNGENEAAKRAAARAIALADDLLKKTPDLYEENYNRALAHAILVSVDGGNLTAAQDAYRTALLHCNTAGIVAWNTGLLNVLIQHSYHESLVSLRTLLATA